MAIENDNRNISTILFVMILLITHWFILDSRKNSSNSNISIMRSGEEIEALIKDKTDAPTHQVTHQLYNVLDIFYLLNSKNKKDEAEKKKTDSYHNFTLPLLDDNPSNAINTPNGCITPPPPPPPSLSLNCCRFLKTGIQLRAVLFPPAHLPSNLIVLMIWKKIVIFILLLLYRFDAAIFSF